MIKRFIFFIGTLRQIVALFIFPTSLQKKKIVEKGKSTFEVSFIEPGLPLIISFAGLGDHFEFKKTFSQYSVNVIYLRDLKHQWYLNELPGVGNEVDDVKEFLENQIKKVQPTKVITIGVSAGGFGALLYGSLLGVDTICAFSPQSFRNKWNCLKYWDYRWLDRVVDICNSDKVGSNRRYLDLKPLLINIRCTTDLYYDKQNRLDRLHAERLIGKTISHYHVSEGGHNVAKVLRDSGELKSIIDRLIMQ